MLHCKADEIAKLEGPGRGVTVIKTGDDDQVIGFIAGRKSDSFEIETEKSGKRFTLNADPKEASARGGKGPASEPDLGSDVAAIRTGAQPDGDDYLISGQKMWVTNSASANLIALLARTPEGASRPHGNLTTFLIEKDSGFGTPRPGLTIPGKIHKMGYRGVDTTELILDQCRVPADRVLGLKPGETKSFRLPFDDLPESWNQVMPQLRIAAVKFS